MFFREVRDFEAFTEQVTTIAVDHHHKHVQSCLAIRLTVLRWIEVVFWLWWQLHRERTDGMQLLTAVCRPRQFIQRAQVVLHVVKLRHDFTKLIVGVAVQFAQYGLGLNKRGLLNAVQPRLAHLPVHHGCSQHAEQIVKLLDRQLHVVHADIDAHTIHVMPGLRTAKLGNDFRVLVDQNPGQCFVALITRVEVIHLALFNGPIDFVAVEPKTFFIASAFAFDQPLGLHAQLGGKNIQGFLWDLNLAEHPMNSCRFISLYQGVVEHCGDCLVAIPVRDLLDITSHVNASDCAILQFNHLLTIPFKQTRTLRAPILFRNRIAASAVENVRRTSRCVNMMYSVLP
ncbi:hypothetical protein D3C71_1292800 [compost metagenome]